MRRAGWLVMAVLIFTAACGRDEQPAVDQGPAEPPIPFERGTVVIQGARDTVRIAVEIAQTDEQRAYGLMRRPSLPEDAGMIFLYDQVQAPEGSFWMFNTLIPLDIAFIGEDGTIGSIVAMEPCQSPYPQWCPGYTANVPFQSALEVNRGFFERRGVGVGDRVVLER